MSRIHLTISLLAAIGFGGCSLVQKSEPARKLALSEPFVKPNGGTLFSSYEEMDISISLPLTTLFKSRKLGRSRFKEFAQLGTMTIGEEKYPIRAQVKGYSSAIMCPFPKMEITILEGRHQNTIFSEAKTFDLNTHCADLDYELDSAFKSSHFNHREALLYRVLDILDVPSLKARPAYVKYFDEDTKVISGPFQAFFLEDMSSFKKRLDAREIKGFDDPEKAQSRKTEDYEFRNVQDSKKLDAEDAARIALFNEMVGNYDWFIKADSQHMRSEKDFRNLWNVKVVELKNDKWIIFPQDFSLAEAVTGIHNPTYYKRVFDLVSLKSQRKIKKNFLDKKEEIMKLSDLLDSDGKKYFFNALTDFFNNLDK